MLCVYFLFKINYHAFISYVDCCVFLTFHLLYYSYCQEKGTTTRAKNGYVYLFMFICGWNKSDATMSLVSLELNLPKQWEILFS
jgi:hypothetical protein